jgi:hypothetical protein
MIRISIAEIVKTASNFKSKKEKVEFLQKHDTLPLRTVLRLIYDKNIEFLLPEAPPPWKKNSLPDTDTMLYREARRLRIFVRGGGYEDLKQVKRESLFISLLEDINNDDAELLANNMLSHTPVKGLTKETVEAAFPTIFTDQIKLS